MALPSPGTLSLELVEDLDLDPDLDSNPDSSSNLGCQEAEQWGTSSEIFLDLEEEQSADVILLDSSELSCPSSPQPGRDQIAYEVRVKQRHIEDICICCGSFQVWTEHPLFEGGICMPCKDKFLNCLFLYDDDGYQSFCSICCSAETLLICENPDCTRCYCFECVDTLVSPGTASRIHAMTNWVCFLCLPLPSNGLLQRRKRWRARLKAFHDQEVESPFEMYKTVPAWKREPVRVLCLFGNIQEELMSLGFLDDSSDNGQLKYLNDVANVMRRDVEEWGPFDIIYGSTPPLGCAFERPPVWYLFHFHRVLQYAWPRPSSPQPFFWMFVDNLVLTANDRDVATRFLETNPVTIKDVCGSITQNAVHVWSNIPAVWSKDSSLAAEEEVSLLVQDRLTARSPATLVKNCFLPLRDWTTKELVLLLPCRLHSEHPRGAERSGAPGPAPPTTPELLRRPPARRDREPFRGRSTPPCVCASGRASAVRTATQGGLLDAEAGAGAGPRLGGGVAGAGRGRDLRRPPVLVSKHRSARARRSFVQAPRPLLSTMSRLSAPAGIPIMRLGRLPGCESWSRAGPSVGVAADCVRKGGARDRARLPAGRRPTPCPTPGDFPQGTAKDVARLCQCRSLYKVLQEYPFNSGLLSCVSLGDSQVS
ncbi:DNA (cytosine-5)-methyltransferase 3-like [Rhynchocyon petersi]